MKKAFRNFRTKNWVEHSDQSNPKSVNSYWYGNRGNNQRRLFPESRLVKICQQNTHHDQGKKIPQTAARIHNLQLGETKINHIPFPVSRHAEKLHCRHTELRRNQLEINRDLVVEEVRKGKHGEAEEKRKRNCFQFPPAKMNPAKTHHYQPKRNIESKIFSPQLPQPKKDYSQNKRYQALPWGNRWEIDQLDSLFPDQIKDYKGNQVAIAVVFSSPLGNHYSKGGIIDSDQQKPIHGDLCQTGWLNNSYGFHNLFLSKRLEIFTTYFLVPTLLRENAYLLSAQHHPQAKK